MSVPTTIVNLYLINIHRMIIQFPCLSVPFATFLFFLFRISLFTTAILSHSLDVIVSPIARLTVDSMSNIHDGDLSL